MRAVTAFLGAIVALLLGACGASSVGGVAASAGARPPPRAAGPVLGGPEHCFDARDDNGNGLVDEGCGVRTGIVQFVLAWGAEKADLDLLVTDPKGELAEPGSPTSAGLVKDRDCPGRRGECGGENYENVYLEKDEALRGVYRVRVRLERFEGEDVPLHAVLAARVGPKTFTAELVFSSPDDEQRLDFRL